LLPGHGLLPVGIVAADGYSTVWAYPPAGSRQPKPLLLPGFLLPLIGCGSVFCYHSC